MRFCIECWTRPAGQSDVLMPTGLGLFGELTPGSSKHPRRLGQRPRRSVGLSRPSMSGWLTRKTGRP